MYKVGILLPNVGKQTSTTCTVFFFSSMKETLGEMFAEIWEVHNSELVCYICTCMTVSTVTIAIGPGPHN